MSLEFLAQLKAKKEILENKIKQQHSKILAQQKKDDTRRKILVGAYYLEKISKEDGMPQLKSELDQFLFRANDRALFDLAPRETIKE
ncbi:MAG: hypothetical protein U1E78_13000 [Gammaproteobacteria bacterium]